MANQLAIRSLLQMRPDILVPEVICEVNSHLYRWESGGLAVHSRVLPFPISGPAGMFFINNSPLNFPVCVSFMWKTTHFYPLLSFGLLLFAPSAGWKLILLKVVFVDCVIFIVMQLTDFAKWCLYALYFVLILGVLFFSLFTKRLHDRGAGAAEFTFDARRAHVQYRHCRYVHTHLSSKEKKIRVKKSEKEGA